MTKSDILSIFTSQLEPQTIEKLKIQRKTMLEAEQLELESTNTEHLPDPKIGKLILLMTTRTYKTRHKYKKYRVSQFRTVSDFNNQCTECTYAGSYYYKNGEDSSKLKEDTALMIFFIHEFQYGIDIEWDPIELS